MNTYLTPQNLMFFIGVVGTIFGVYKHFKNPQIDSDKEDIRIKSELARLQLEIKDIKETHLRTLESEIKSLNGSVNELSKTVVKLATIIDERIPKK